MEVKGEERRGLRVTRTDKGKNWEWRLKGRQGLSGHQRIGTNRYTWEGAFLLGVGIHIEEKG